METKDIKGFNIKKICTVLILLEAILFVCSILCSIEVFRNYKNVNQITDDYIGIQGNIYSLQAASDLMSAKSRQYVMTGRMNFAYEYFNEVNENKRRDRAVESIAERISAVGYGASEPIENALSKSNNLMKKEINAMALIASIYEKEEDCPEELKNYILSDEEKKLSLDEKKEKAYSLVFGNGYSNDKLSIRASVDEATEKLLGEVGAYKAFCSKRYQFSFLLLMILLALSVFIFAIIAVCLFRLVLQPIEVSIAAIREEKLIPLCNSYEINYLAATYNIAYEENATTRLHLKNKAERDELTGLLNRSAFNGLVDFYKAANEELAFLIIDVDDFKTVNDTYGHAIGDLALQKVASLLKECFRANDFPIRYGGDEFVVIMTELGSEQKGVIKRKLEYINAALQSPDSDELPKLSVSIGVAFSQRGFEEDLFEKADSALYQTKQNGRCGYTFYN